MSETAAIPTVGEVEDRLAILVERIERAGRGLEDVRIVAVTKAFPPAIVAVARDAGFCDLGENYAQELLAKMEAAGSDGVRWHFIGRLQRNKVRTLAERVDLWQSVDRAPLIEEIAKRAPGSRILVQLNATGEPDKGGASPAEVDDLVARASDLGLRVEGLMGVGPTEVGASPIPAFRSLREIADRLGLAERSMGMSGDLEEALAEGATMVRIGTGLFGPRIGRRT